MNATAYIALGLGFFFLLVSVLKGFAARAERRRLADVRSAALNGGTPDAPVHLESPFAKPPEPGKPAGSPATPATPADPNEEPYVWE